MLKEQTANYLEDYAPKLRPFFKFVDALKKGKVGQASPPPTDKVPDMPAEDWRNAGLHLLMLLAQAYYKLLESAIGVPCAAVDMDMNHSYLWTLKNIRNLLDNHPDLVDFPGPFEPVFPDLYPSSVRDVDWEDMVAPDAERFLSTVQEYVMDKGIHSPEEHSPAWIFIELFKPGVTSAIDAGEAYRKRMNQHFAKLMAQVSKRHPAQAPAASGANQPKAESMHAPLPATDHAASESCTPDIADGSSIPTGWKGLQVNKPFEPRTMLWNGKPFAIEEPSICYKGYDLENQSLEDYYPDLHDDWEQHIKDVQFDEVENLRILRLVGHDKTLLIHVMLRDSVPVYPERLENSGESDGWYDGGVAQVSGQRFEVKGIRVEPTDAQVRARIETVQRSRAALPTADRNSHEPVPTVHREPTKEIQMKELRCFITHGHDHGLKWELKDYLQNTLGLPEPTILHQQPNRGRTVIEKFEECSQDIDVAFVLLTPDDIGGLSTKDLRDRARQNVICELGVFVGRFGRRSGRVILLHKGSLELPSDMAGVVYIDVSSGIQAAGELIRNELQGLTRFKHA